jgi:transposase
MSYSLDLRERTVRFVKEGGGPTEASRVFGVSRKTLYNWLGRSTLKATPRLVRNGKIDKAKLVSHVNAYPDALLHERARQFGVTPSGICRALRKLGIGKKNDTVRRNKLQ